MMRLVVLGFCIVSLLAGADTRLADAAKTMDPAAIRALIQKHIDVNAPQIDGSTALHWAANNDALLLGAWWWFVAPGLCIAVLGAGLAFINFGIDEIANPRLRTGKKSKGGKRLKSGKASA